MHLYVYLNHLVIIVFVEIVYAIVVNVYGKVLSCNNMYPVTGMRCLRNTE
jgi:hypothetical protein